jgi:diguanylate cyclase (GGDEF)-like protein
LVGIFNDITDLWRRDEQIRFLAYHDALTGLPNRALLLDRLGHAMLVAERERSSLALLFLDLDRFKQVNDNLGHEVGDLLLQEVAKRIKSCLRETDTVARLGGDEFIVMLENLATRQPAGEIAESLISSLSSPYLLKDHPIEIGASAGIALFPDHGREVEELIQDADQAMYAAKNAGRGVVRYFQEAQAAR